jgi:hypothetical protein
MSKPTPWCLGALRRIPRNLSYRDMDRAEFVSHVAIRDGDRMVCTHCGETLKLLTYAPFDVTTDDQEEGM